MKPDLSEPPRLTDAGTGRLADLLRAERSRGPSAEAAQRLAKDIVPAKLAERAARQTKTGAPASVLTGGAAVVLVSLALLTWRSTDVARPSTGSRPEPAAVATATPLAPQTSDEEAPAPAADIPTLDVDALPAPSTDVRAPSDGEHGASAKAKTDRRAAPPAPARRPTELELLVRARSSLTSDPARCLQIAGEHAAAYPDGQFVQEREVIVIEALSRLGRREEARARAASFLARYPKTPYSARIEIAVGPL